MSTATQIRRFRSSPATRGRRLPTPWPKPRGATDELATWLSRRAMKNLIARDARPLIAHVIYRLDVGGLENGVVNLLNRLPVERFRHAVIALTEVTPFRGRV